MPVLTWPIGFGKFLDMLKMHYLSDKPSCRILHTMRYVRTRLTLSIKEEYVGTICYKQKVET